MHPGQGHRQFDLDEGRRRKFLEQARLAAAPGAAVIVMAFDEKGQADTFARKIEICRRAYDLLLGIGFPAEDIIFDPNIFAIATGIPEHDNYAVDFIGVGALDQAEPAGDPPYFRRRFQRFLQFPRQRPGARGHPHRLPLPRHPGRT